MITWSFKVDKPIFLILHGHSIEGLKKHWDTIKEYDVLFASMNNCLYLNKFVKKPLDFIIYYCTAPCTFMESKHMLNKAEARGNSLLEFIYQCEENNVKELVLFGADGYSDTNSPYYYEKVHAQQTSTHIKECGYFNKTLPKDLKLKITNVSPDSHFNLDNITYEEFLKRPK